MDIIRKNRERLRKKACGRYQNLSEEETNKKQKYGSEEYKNSSEKKKDKRRQNDRERLVEYKKYYSTQKIKVRQNLFWVNISNHFSVYGLVLSHSIKKLITLQNLLTFFIII